MTPETLKKANEFDKKIKGFEMAEHAIEEFKKDHDKGIQSGESKYSLKTFTISDGNGKELKFTGDEVSLNELIDLNYMLSKARSMAESYKKDLEKL